MTYAVGDTISFIATFRNPDGSAATGLTVTSASKFGYTKAGVSITFPSLSSFSEIASTGSYRATAVPVTAGIYTVVAHASGAYLFPDYVCDPAEVVTAAADPAALATAIAAVAAKTDVATSTRAVAGAVITASSPVTSQGSIEIVQGDDYDADDDRALIFNLTSVPDLTAAVSATLVISWGVDSVSVAGVITNAGAATQTVTAELTAEQTILMPVTGTTYQLRAVIASTNVVTLKRGRVIVLEAVPAN